MHEKGGVKNWANTGSIVREIQRCNTCLGIANTRDADTRDAILV